jgi:hypothetical protein
MMELKVKDTAKLIRLMEQHNRDHFWAFVKIAVEMFDNVKSADSGRVLRVTVMGWKRNHPIETAENVWAFGGGVAFPENVLEKWVSDTTSLMIKQAAEHFDSFRTKNFDEFRGSRSIDDLLGVEEDSQPSPAPPKPTIQ